MVTFELGWRLGVEDPVLSGCPELQGWTPMGQEL